MSNDAVLYTSAVVAELAAPADPDLAVVVFEETPVAAEFDLGDDVVAVFETEALPATFEVTGAPDVSDPTLGAAVVEEPTVNADIETGGVSTVVDPSPLVVRGPQGAPGPAGVDGETGRLEMPDGSTPTDGSFVRWDSQSQSLVASETVDGGFF